jgi:hypothetical protein
MHSRHPFTRPQTQNIYKRERERKTLAIYFAATNIGFGDKLAASEKFLLKARKLDGLLTFSIDKK